ncbi:MAG: site-specific DNA-methyltransferase, partial [ANME-2 cluster archaeon]|nr:site-specific DNA-methyltransferase [ANME-2 cluster archaeon]
MDGKSLDITEERLNKLKEILPDAFTEGKIDWEKLQASLGEDIEFKNERYVLNWAGKSNAFRVLQSPTTATLVPCKEESIDFDDTENIFIEGENLEVLKVLQKSYFGKIKMIYIDPPYNTGNDKFIYPDKFSETRDEYLSRIGDKDETGYMTREGLFRKNSKDSGHYHSNWLSMMYPRLFLARNLLREDGVIFVSIDDNEVHNLRLLMNEVFGEENFLSCIIWKKRSSPDARTVVGCIHDYVLCYVKESSISQKAVSKLPLTDERKNSYQNPDNDPRGLWASVDMTGMTGRAPKTQYYEIQLPSGKVIKPPQGRAWGLALTTFLQMKADNRIWFGKDGNNVPRIKRFLSESEGQVVSSFWDMSDVGSNDEAKKSVNDILANPDLFDTPKPTRLIKRMLEISTSEQNSDIILDFFAGSGTTAHAVLDINKEHGGNRKFILVQIPEKCDENSEAYKAGYKTIADIGKERIRRVIKKIKEDKQTKLDVDGNAGKQDLGFKVFKL